jgi:tetratricopeptide (TPR) repeat protein
MFRYYRILLLSCIVLAHCAGLGCRSAIELDKLANPCAEDEFSGRAIVEVKKGDLQGTIDNARLGAIKDVLEAHESMVSVYLESDTEAGSKGKKEHLIKKFEKQITEKIYGTVLKEKVFKESIVNNHVICFVCVNKEIFKQGIEETREYRAKRLNTACEYYRQGQRFKAGEARDALQLYTKAKEILEEIEAMDELYEYEEGKKVVLYTVIDKEILRTNKRIHIANHLYTEAEEAVTGHKLETARTRLVYANSYAMDYDRYNFISEKIGKEEEAFESLINSGDQCYNNREYERALAFYKKAAQVNQEDRTIKDKVRETRTHSLY